VRIADEVYGRPFSLFPLSLSELDSSLSTILPIAAIAGLPLSALGVRNVLSRRQNED